ncbi:MAG: hypothetical protein HZA51_12770 [Planctomycetes bacterium]|nr:hypothetical protein [Planctomycetota bacterium]
MSTLVNDALIFAGSSLAVVAGVAIALRRRQERSNLEGWAQRHGWTLDRDRGDALRERLAAAAIMQIGHSRRMAAVVRDANDVVLFEYFCETGLEHDRQTHRWVGVVVPIFCELGRATFTREPWVIAAATAPGMIRIDRADGTPASSTGRFTLLTEDPPAWSSRLDGEFGRRLAADSPARTWELLSNCLLGYQPGPIPDEQVAELASSGKELAKLI